VRGNPPDAAHRLPAAIHEAEAKETAMATLIAIVAAGLLAAVVIVAVIGVVSLAIRREDRNLTLTSETIDTVTRLVRRLNGVYVRVPRQVPAAEPTTPA
jgi:hypothetical protein